MKQKNFEKTFYCFTEENETSDTVVEEVLLFWRHYDKLFSTNHYEIINFLLSPASRHLTNAGIGMKFNICERTLLRYKNLYLESYLKFGTHSDAPAQRFITGC